MASRAARHRFDPVSFVLGVMAVTAGLIVLGGGSLLDDATVLFPAGLIALGVAILLQVGTRREEPPLPVTVPSPPTVVAGQTLSGAELYDLLVPDPTEEFLAELEERERSARPPGGELPVVETDREPEPEPAARARAGRRPDRARCRERACCRPDRPGFEPRRPWQRRYSRRMKSGVWGRRSAWRCVSIAKKLPTTVPLPRPARSC